MNDSRYVSQTAHGCGHPAAGGDHDTASHEGDEMFGKTKELNEVEMVEELETGDFFGDETAAAESAKVDDLETRVRRVESQINSQFTSMAAYAQIAQEQVELARSEASVSVDRSEKRVVQLIERERKDRIAGMHAASGGTGSWAAPESDARIAALESAVTEIRHGLAECLARQKALADAITALFEPVSDAPRSETLPPPSSPPADQAGAIDGLSLA